MIRSTFASCVILLTLTACGGPLRFGPPLPLGMDANRKASPASTDDPSTPETKDGTAIPIEGGLTVQSEILAPGDIWGDQIPELKRRAASASQREFQQWVIQQSAALITDRIAESLLYQKANSLIGDKAGPSVQSYVDGEIRKVVTEKFEGIQRRYEKSLEEQGQTIEDVRQQFRRQAIIGAYIESDVRKKIPEPTRAELFEVFERNRESMRRPERRSMSLVDIRTSNFYPEGLSSPTRAQRAEAKANARSEALAALEELRSGKPFAEVARRRSHGLHAQDGGKWGWITPDAVRERFLPAVAAIQELSQGQVSELLEVPDGFFIVCCDQAQEAYEPNFVTAQPLIHRRIISQRHNGAIGAEVARLRSEAGVKEDSLRAFHKRVVDFAILAAAAE